MSKISRSSLLTDIISNIYTNVTNIISGNILQDRLKNIADSCVNWLTDVDTDNTLSANSDLKVSSQKATKAYIDNVSATIPSITNVQNSEFIQAVASGIDTYAANMTPSVTSYVAGQLFELRNITANTITGITININGLGARNIVSYKSTVINVGDFVGTVLVAYDGTNFRMIGGGGSVIGATQATVNAGTNTDQFVAPRTASTVIQNNRYKYASASGTDTYTSTFTPAITALTVGMKIDVLFTNANLLTTSTLNVGLGAVTIVSNNLGALQVGEIKAGAIATLGYTGTTWQLMGGGSVADATPSVKGIAKLYSNVTNNNTDGAPDQNSVKVALATKQNSLGYTPLNKAGDTITGDIDSSATGYFRIPSGTTAQRPVTPLDGMRRYNTTTLRDEFYANGSWQNHARLAGDTFTGAISATNLSGTNTGDNATNSQYSGLQAQITAVTQSIDDTAMNIYLSQNLI